MPILQLKALKAPKSGIFPIMPYKPKQSTIFEKTFIEIAESNRWQNFVLVWTAKL